MRIVHEMQRKDYEFLLIVFSFFYGYLNFSDVLAFRIGIVMIQDVVLNGITSNYIAVFMDPLDKHGVVLKMVFIGADHGHAGTFAPWQHGELLGCDVLGWFDFNEITEPAEVPLLHIRF